MSGLIENAQRILDTAADAVDVGLEPSEWTIFIGSEGGLEMIAGVENSLDSLAWSRGARMAWQVRHLAGGVRVDGMRASERCQLQQGAARQTAEMLLGGTRMYELAYAV